MQRQVLESERVHPDIRERIAGNHRELIDEVEQALSEHRVVVVGMAQNPHPRRARAALSRAGIAHHYLEYGSYLSMWRRRGSLKMWTGWPTFPMVFVDGKLVGGASEVIHMIESGQLKPES